MEIDMVFVKTETNTDTKRSSLLLYKMKENQSKMIFENESLGLCRYYNV